MFVSSDCMCVFHNFFEFLHMCVVKHLFEFLHVGGDSADC